MKKLLFLLILVAFAACSGNNTSTVETHEAVQQSEFTGMLAADTIIYDVVIRNPNPEDSWTESCLAGLKRTELVDSIFALVYSEKIIAYDFDTHEMLRKKDIKQLETDEDFSRDKIGKIQFKEKWFFDQQRMTFSKQVVSMIPGYEVYDDAGELRGYKPVFVLYMK